MIYGASNSPLYLSNVDIIYGATNVDIFYGALNIDIIYGASNPDSISRMLISHLLYNKYCLYLSFAKET